MTIAPLAKPLDDDQIAMVDMIKETLAMALEGRFRGLAIVVSLDNGFSHAICGKPGTGPEMNLACDDLKRQILETALNAPKTKATSRIIRGRA